MKRKRKRGMNERKACEEDDDERLKRRELKGEKRS